MSRISEAVAVASDIDSEIVDVPEWGVKIGIRSMDGHRRSQFMKAFSDARESGGDDDLGRIEADLLIYCCFDPEDSSPCFSAEDVDMLLTKSGKVLGDLSRKASELSGLTPDSEKKVLTDS